MGLVDICHSSLFQLRALQGRQATLLALQKDAEQRLAEERTQENQRKDQIVSSNNKQRYFVFVYTAATSTEITYVRFAVNSCNEGIFSNFEIIFCV